MALVNTTLSKPKTLNGSITDKLVTLTSATGATTAMLLKVGAEVMRITDVSLTPTLGVVPGYAGTTAGPHGVLAPATFGIPADFVATQGLNPQNEITSLSFGVDGAITGPGGAGTIPVADTVVYLTKATAGAYTLALPAADQQNQLTILNSTAVAHVLVMTGNPATQDTATFVAALGGRLDIRANFGVWSVVGVQGVVVA